MLGDQSTTGGLPGRFVRSGGRIRNVILLMVQKSETTPWDV